MEIIGVTRLVDGKEVNEFVVGCTEHNYFYKGLPPLTHGCASCWHSYFFSQIAQAGGDIKANVEQLESAIKHTAESVEKGEWDFKPDYHVEFGEEN